MNRQRPTRPIRRIVGRNLTNEAHRWRRIAFANAHFGLLVMSGVYSERGSIIEIVDNRRPEMISEISKFGDFPTFLRGIAVGFRRFRS